MDAISEAPKARVPILSPVTFTRFVENHRAALPTRIDRSLMSSLSGGDQVNVLSALRFFNLIDASGKPTHAFENLRDLSETELVIAWRSLLENAYPSLFDGSINLSAASRGELEEKFRDYSISGDTVRKAVAFFLSIARSAGATLSPHFRNTASRATSTSSRPQPRKRRMKAASQPEPTADPAVRKPAPDAVVLTERLHRSVYGWIEELPQMGEPWQRQDFEAWLSTLRSMLERLYRIE